MTLRRRASAFLKWAFVILGAAAAGHGGCARGARSEPSGIAPAPIPTGSPVTAPPSAAKREIPGSPQQGSAPESGRESLVARGILAGPDGTVALFTDVHRCTTERTLPSGQVWLSTDAGKTFSKRGPALEGSSFDVALAAPGGQLWVVGLHTAEGPGIDPFVLVPGAGTGELVLRPVREGPSEIADAARLRNGDLLVWIRDLDGAGVGPARGKHLYESHDQGKTWQESPRAPTAGQTRFPRLGNRSREWRIADRPDGGFEVQRLVAKTWQTVTQFPWLCRAP